MTFWKCWSLDLSNLFFFYFFLVPPSLQMAPDSLADHLDPALTSTFYSLAPSSSIASQTTLQAWLSVTICFPAFLITREKCLNLAENITNPPASAGPSATTSILSLPGFPVNCCCYLVTKLFQTLLRTIGLQPARLLCPWDFPGKNNWSGL